MLRSVYKWSQQGQSQPRGVYKMTTNSEICKDLFTSWWCQLIWCCSVCVCQREREREREMLLLIDESIWQEKLSVLSEEKYRHFPRDKVSFKVGWYCGNWWLLTLILITTITRRSAQWRGWPEARRWTICGWSSLPTISFLEDGRAGA